MINTTVISLIMIGSIAAIIAFLIFVARRQGQRRTQRLKAAYSTLLSQHGLAPDHVQVFEHRIFALDGSKQQFAFVQNDEHLSSGVIDLAEVVNCKLWKDGVQISRSGNSRAGSVEEHINAVGLSFIRKSGIVINVPIYSEQLDGIEQKIALNKAAAHWLRKIKLMQTGNLNYAQAAE
jgi:hypothetical protein